MAKRSAGKRMRMIGRMAGHRVKQLEVKTRQQRFGADRDWLSYLEKGTKGSFMQQPKLISIVRHRMITSCEWLPHKEEFMRVLLELEAPPDPRNCISCGTDGLVQHWNGEFFEESALHMTGAQLQLGHIGAACLSDPSNANGTGGPVKMNAPEWEDVDDVPPHMPSAVYVGASVKLQKASWLQLLRAKLFPATFEKTEYCIYICSLGRFCERQPGMWDIRDELLLKTATGDFWCLSSPSSTWDQCRPGGRSGSHASDGWKFQSRHMHDRRPADQVWLMDGHGFMVTDPDYQTYLKVTPHITEKSCMQTIIRLLIRPMPNGKQTSPRPRIGERSGYHINDVASSSWQFRQLNMDYSLANALQYNMTGINRVLCFYDINCSYMKNLHTRESECGMCTVHKQECYARYAPLFMQGAGWVDGEIIETLWSLLNIASTSAQGHEFPTSQELLDFQISDCNFMKMIRMVDSLIQETDNRKGSRQIWQNGHSRRWMKQCLRCNVILGPTKSKWPSETEWLTPPPWISLKCK
ncbi:hypothetical protein BKA82DRAFT_4017598 [Pisolithus tinctorius]|nr:hypothetical protein BKA82DRAFT_4017598 [Pisolithus tinctorius]